MNSKSHQWKLALTAAAVAGLFLVTAGPSQPNCTPIPVEPVCAAEGEYVPVVPDMTPCCEGLSAISSAEYDPDTGLCAFLDGAVICAACGDGVCGLEENPCNCPDDCQQADDCVPAGDTYPVIPDHPECCPGLHGAAIYELMNGECMPMAGAGICIACGDGVCGLGEDVCNCAEDCASVEECVPEGESFPIIPGALPCCDGLVPVGCDAPTSAGQCMGCEGASYCTACGDGVCGPAENACRCPEDCR